MNLVTAVLVENAMEIAKNDHAEQKMLLRAKVIDLVPKLEAVFDSVDVERTGEIKVTDVAAVEVNQFPAEFEDILSHESLEDVFTMFDLDGSGDLDKDEFVEGMINLMLSDVPKEMLVMMKMVKVQHERGSDVDRQLQLLKQMVTDLTRIYQFDTREDTKLSVRSI